MKKFGEILTSRPAGKEAYLSALAYLLPKDQNEHIVLDFAGVIVLSPSWGDEFIGKLMEERPGRITFLHTDNPSVQATLDILKKTARKP